MKITHKVTNPVKKTVVKLKHGAKLPKRGLKVSKKVKGYK